MLSLILLFVLLTYWRSGGAEDIRKVRYELDTLRTWQKEFTESLAESLTIAYDRSRQRLQAARGHLRELKENTAEGLEQQVKHANEQLDELARRLDEKAKAAKDATLKTAQSVEHALGIRVRRIQARTDLLRAKLKVNHAVDAAEIRDFDRAEQFLSEATDLLQAARKTLGDDLAYNELIFQIKWELRDATAAVRSQAENIRQKIERVLSDADRLVGSLESDEREAAGTSS